MTEAKAMKRIAISELEGAALDWAVAVSAGFNVSLTMAYPSGSSPQMAPWDDDARRPCMASRDWQQCGPLIERYKVELNFHEEYVADDGAGPVWEAMLAELWLVAADEYDPIGKTPLIAACRAIVASHNPSGYVEVPDELVEVE